MDAQGITDFEIHETILMENAGTAALSVIARHMRIDHSLKAIIICGAGNNGGDGLVLARQLASRDAYVSIMYLTDPGQYRGAAKTNHELVVKYNLPSFQYDENCDLPSILAGYNLVVDAIFGTGLERPVTGKFALVIRTINESKLPVLSLDIPSGINADNGQVMGEAILATWTVTFGLPKPGNLLFPGYLHQGDLYVSHISFPPALLHSDDLFVEVNTPPSLPPRMPHGHKGTFGQLLTIAGSAHYFGAPLYSAYSYLKAGGGYSRLAAPSSLVPHIANKASELVFIPLIETQEGSVSHLNKNRLIDLANQSDMTTIGPGMSLDQETQQLIRELVTEIHKPILIDGDGLSAVSHSPHILANRTAPTILTPHLGEMEKLTKIPKADLLSNPVNLLRSFSQEVNAIVVLKGAHSLIGFPNGSIFVNMSGNSGMATAGSGDVLTGTIAAMYGLGLEISDSVRKGVFIHGFAGDLAADKIGLDGMTAQDILEHLPEAMKLDREGSALDWKPAYSGAIII